MEVVCDKIKKIKCIDDDCNVLELNRVISFDECIDTITVESGSYNTELKRGWVGDLVYEANPCRDLITGDQIDGLVASDCYRDVVLSHVRPMQGVAEPTTWEYCFLKK